jgi:hypothetical protein
MTQAESLKEAIGWLKIVFGLLVAVDISLIAWLAQNYETAKATLLLLAWAATIATTIAIAWVLVRASRHIKALRDI